jgi:hypothetical protein
MKKLTIILAALFIALGINTKAFADEAATLKDAAGVTPDSIVYPLDKAIDQLVITLTFGDANNAEAITKVAEERLGESEVMTEEGKTELAKKAIEEYNTKMEDVVQKIKAILENTDESISIDKAAEIEASVQAIIKEHEDTIKVLEEIKAQLPEEDQKDVENTVEEQTGMKTEVRAMVDARHALNDARKAYNTLKSGNGKEVLDKEGNALTLDEAKTAYEAAQVKFQDAFTAKQEAVNKNYKNDDSDTTTPAAIKVSPASSNKSDKVKPAPKKEVSNKTAADETVQNTTTSSQTTVDTQQTADTKSNNGKANKVNSETKSKGKK